MERGWCKRDSNAPHFAVKMAASGGFIPPLLDKRSRPFKNMNEWEIQWVDLRVVRVKCIKNYSESTLYVKSNFA